MVTIEQCRAARGLLGWTQQDLADACGLSKTAINNFEKGHSDIKAESLKSISMAFESLDIEFIGQNGLRRCYDRADIVKGLSAYNAIFDSVLPTVRQDKSEFLILNMGDKLTNNIPLEKIQLYISELEKHGIGARIICAENTTMPAGLSAQYRWIPQEQTKYMPTRLIYGTNIAVQFGKNAFMTLINSREESLAHRKEFDAIWAEAKTYKSIENPRKSNATAN